MLEGPLEGLLRRQTGTVLEHVITQAHHGRSHQLGSLRILVVLQVEPVEQGQQVAAVGGELKFTRLVVTTVQIFVKRDQGDQGQWVLLGEADGHIHLAL